MANFLLVYTGGQEPQSEAEGKAMMDAWMAWFGTLGSAVVDGGNPIGAAAKNISSDGKVSDGPVGVPATGYSILAASSLDEAVEMAKGCPHLGSQGQITVYETYPAM